MRLSDRRRLIEYVFVKQEWLHLTSTDKNEETKTKSTDSSEGGRSDYCIPTFSCHWTPLTELAKGVTLRRYIRGSISPHLMKNFQFPTEFYSATRATIKNEGDKSATRSTIKNEGDKSATRATIKNEGDKSATRATINEGDKSATTATTLQRGRQICSEGEKLATWATNQQRTLREPGARSDMSAHNIFGEPEEPMLPAANFNASVE
jgi:hypothetical protein